jgi:hypothetical protein
MFKRFLQILAATGLVITGLFICSQVVAAAADIKPLKIQNIIHYLISQTADITITAVPNWHQPPQEFTVTRITDQNVLAEWSNGSESLQSMIRVGFGSYPTSVTDGYLVYLGEETSANDTSINLDQIGEGYYSAFTEYSEGWTTTYSTGYVEGTGMLLIGQVFQSLLILLGVALLNWLAFWQRHIFLYLLMVPVNVVYGLLTASQSTLYSTQWVVGIVVSILGLFFMFRVTMKLIRHE